MRDRITVCTFLSRNFRYIPAGDMQEADAYMVSLRGDELLIGQVWQRTELYDFKKYTGTESSRTAPGWKHLPDLASGVIFKALRTSFIRFAI